MFIARLRQRLLPSRPVSRFSHRIRLRSNAFRYARRYTLFGVARLFGDRIELTSLNLSGFRTRTIYFDTIAHMDYHPLAHGSNVSLVLDTGEQVDLRLRQAHVWRDFFENWLRYDVLPSAKLMPDPEEAMTTSG